MQRRDFLRNTAILGAVMATPSTILGGEKAIGKKRAFGLSLNHEILEKGKQTRLWIPLPLITEYQKVSDIKFDGNFNDPSVDYGEIPTLYAGYVGVAKPTLNIKFSVETFERNTDFSKVKFNPNEKLNPEVAKFLEPSAQIQIDGVVKQKSDEIAGGIKGDLEKARVIYTWVANTMQRDNSVLGCGLGDVKQILSSGKLSGKCTDINSVFVALCRAQGIAAREMFGIRVGASRFSAQMGAAPKDGVSHISGAQHCRAEFYLKGYGWIPVDPADVTKVRLGEGLSEDDSKLARVREYLFGNWEPCWLGFNYAREIVLNPRPAHVPIEIFSHPYCEVGGTPKDPYSPKNFIYEYFSREI